MKHILYVSFLLLLIHSCKEEFDIINLNGNEISVLGHGGMGIEDVYPLNSFESIQNCLSLGADGTEIDVQMTKDGILVAFHDELLEHSTNFEGPIYQQNWADIKEATFKIPLYAQYKMVSLDHLFSSLISTENFTFFLDCKNFNPDTSSVYLNTFNNALIQLIDDHDLSNNVVVEFKRLDLIKSLKNKRPDLRISIFNGFEFGLSIANEFQLEAITIDYRDITKEEVKEAHDNGIKVAVFNTHSKNRNIEAIEKNVDFIQTDKLKHLLKILK